MTREEAIGVMRDLWCFWKSERYSDREIREACEIAIEALKEEKVHLICPHCLKDMYYTKVTHTIELGGDEE